MRVVIVPRHGGPEVLEIRERPTPEPGPGEARLKILAVGLNHLDLWVRRGVPGHSFPLPIIPGCDAAARVEALGPGASTPAPGTLVLLAPGIGCGSCPSCHSGRDHLCRRYGIFGETRDGACADSMIAPLTHLLPYPAGLSLAQAASIPLTLLTAWHMVVDRAGLRAGETMLVHAAGSGVGVMAVQIGCLLGAQVIATVGDSAKAAPTRALGASHVLLYRECDVAQEARRLTQKRGVDVIIDHIGVETFEPNVRALAKGGRLVVCGATTGAEVRFDLRHLFFKGLSVLGSTMGGRGELDEAMRFVADGRIRPVVDTIVPMSDVRLAHERLEARKAFGKVVLAGFDTRPEDLLLPRSA